MNEEQRQRRGGERKLGGPLLNFPPGALTLDCQGGKNPEKGSRKKKKDLGKGWPAFARALVQAKEKEKSAFYSGKRCKKKRRKGNTKEKFAVHAW